MDDAAASKMFVKLLVIGNIVTIIGTNFGERLMCLPSVFFLILLAMLITKLNRPAIPHMF